MTTHNEDNYGVVLTEVVDEPTHRIPKERMIDLVHPVQNSYDNGEYQAEQRYYLHSR
jgi:hypothetical protein